MNHLKRLIVPAMLALLLAACNQGSGGNTGTPAPKSESTTATQQVSLFSTAAYAADVAPAPKGPNPRFYDVTRRLDAGGSFYMYADVKDVLHNFVAGFQPMVGSAPPAVQQMYAKVDQSLNQLGLYGIQDVGISSFPENGLYLNKCFISMPEGIKGVPALLGQTPHKIESLAYAPGGVLFYFQTDLNFDQLLGTVRTLVAQFQGPQAVEQFNQILAVVNMQLNVNIELLIKSLGNRVTVFADQDPQQMVNVGPNASGQIKAPRLALMLSVKDDTLYKALTQKAMAFGYAGAEQKGNGLSVTTLNVPPNPQYRMTPIIVGGQEFVIVSTHTEMVAAMLKAAKTGGLADNVEFKQLSAGLPTDGNGMMFISKGFFDAMRQLTSIMQSQARNNQQAQIGAMANKIPQSGIYAIRRQEQNGIMIYSRSASSGQQAIAAVAVLPAAIMSVIAVPNFVEAQSRSHVSKVQSDLRSLSVGIESYALDCSAYPAWSANPNENFYKNYVGKAPQLAGVPTFAVAQNLYLLTTPMSYMNSYSPDPYAPAQGATYAFYSILKPAPGWIVWSPGPDRKYDLNAGNIQQAYQPSPMPSAMLMGLTYDATNGTNSAGDIWRIRTK